MAKWFYYNESGEKIEVTGGQLKGLAKAGMITPDTVVETEEGKVAPARRVKGLTFGVAQSETATSKTSTSVSEVVTLPSAPSPFGVTPPTTTNPLTPTTPKGDHAEQQNVFVPAAVETKSSLWITLIGILIISGVGFVGWKIVSVFSTHSEQAIQALLPAEQTEANSYITKFGRDAILHYLEDTQKDVDKNRILRYVKYFVSQGADVTAKDDFGNTPLYLAAASGNGDVVRLLVSEGASVDAKSDTGSPPLCGAVLNGNAEIIEFLVSKGADVNAKDSLGWSPLHGAACKKDIIGVMKFLISQGADVNAKNDNGDTPLHNAVITQDTIEVVEFLISKGLDVNAKNNDGVTPLHFASLENKNIGVLEFLVSKGANVIAKDNVGKTPLDYAKKEQNTAVVNYLSGLPEVQEHEAAVARASEAREQVAREARERAERERVARENAEQVARQRAAQQQAVQAQARAAAQAQAAARAREEAIIRQGIQQQMRSPSGGGSSPAGQMNRTQNSLELRLQQRQR